MTRLEKLLLWIALSVGCWAAIVGLARWVQAA